MNELNKIVVRERILGGLNSLRRLVNRKERATIDNKHWVIISRYGQRKFNLALRGSCARRYLHTGLFIHDADKATDPVGSVIKTVDICNKLCSKMNHNES